jgi:hypothetical protein
MSLPLLPIELLDEISIHLSLHDVFALTRVCKQLHNSLIETLYRFARNYRKASSSVLTTGLQDVTFWFDKDGNSSVVEWAICHRRFSTFERLIVDPNMDLLQADSYGVTLLHRLSGQGLAQYIEPLTTRLKHIGIDPFQVDYSLLTPLHYAAGRGMTHAVHALIVLGAEVSAKDHHGNTPLHLAAVTGSYQVFTLLVEAGADVNSESRFRWAPIDQASISHHYIAVNSLRRLGSRPPTWQQRRNALNEFVRLSPCPLECYLYHMNFL